MKNLPHNIAFLEELKLIDIDINTYSIEKILMSFLAYVQSGDPEHRIDSALRILNKEG